MDALYDPRSRCFFVYAQRNYGRYEVGRLFGAVERLKRASEEQNHREAQTAFAAMSVAYDRYLKASMTKHLLDEAALFYSCIFTLLFIATLNLRVPGRRRTELQTGSIENHPFNHAPCFGPSLKERVGCPAKRESVCDAKLCKA